MINVEVEVKKGSVRGWIQNYKDTTETIQYVEFGDKHGSNARFTFESYDEWKKFVEFFNVTEITDMRKAD